MKQFRLIFATLGLLTLATACTESHESSATPDGRTALQVTTASIGTRATDNAWEANDAIGITLFDAGTKNLVDGKRAYKYITNTASGAFSPADKDNTAYFPSQGKAADVTAFYPYTEIDENLMIPISTANQQQLSAIDLMTTDLGTGYSSINSNVALTFKHRLSKLVIIVDKEYSAAEVDLTDATITLRGTSPTAQWSLTEAKLTAESAPADIAVPAVTTKDGINATAIALPTAAGKGVSLVITTAGGKRFDASLANNLALMEGTVNTLRVHLRKTETSMTFNIADWTTGHTIDLQAIRIDGLGTGNTPAGNYKPAQDDELTLTSSGLATNLTATYIANAAQEWTSSTPLYWDSFAAADAPFTFHVLINPQPDGAHEKDYLKGTATGVAYGAPLDFSTKGHELIHAMSQISITLLLGTGFETASLDNATVTLPTIRPLGVIAPDGGMTLGNAAALVLTPNAGATNDKHTYNERIAPQGFAEGYPLVVVTIEGKSYTYKAPAGGLVFESNKLNKLTLSLTKTGVEVLFSVADWEKGFEINGGLELE